MCLGTLTFPKQFFGWPESTLGQIPQQSQRKANKGEEEKAERRAD